MNNNIKTATKLTDLNERDQKDLIFRLQNKMRSDTSFFKEVVSKVNKDSEFDDSGIVRKQLIK